MSKFSIFPFVICLHIQRGFAQNDIKCRSMDRLHDRTEEYSLHVYGMCYKFLFYDRLIGMYKGYEPFLLWHGSTILLSQDYKNETARANICATLSDDECQQWTSCCAAADECCKRQQSQSKGKNSSCPRIWDGWSCFDDALPGSKIYTSCPSFLQLSSPSRQAVKTCLSNGSWIGRTDYTPCSNYNELETSLLLGFGCSVVSIVFIIPAIFIFLIYKLLRKQHRIRLHVNLFIALLLKELMTVLWDMLVTYDKLKNDEVFDTVLMKNEVGCKILMFLKLYFNCCCFTWMFCEGFYLHRLMSNAFSPPRSLIPVYLAGWLLPLTTSTLYSILRGIYANDRCWALPFNNLEWIVSAPNLLFLVINVIFLCNILRILLTQVQSHPNEPGTFRRAVKATFVLIPLFGVQLFVTAYRIPTTVPGGLEYERFSMIVNNLQGFLVALVFCFLNGEVLSQLRRSVRRRIRDRFGTSRRMNNTLNQTLSMRSEYDGQRFSETHSSLLQTNNHKKDCIPLDEKYNEKCKSCDLNYQSSSDESRHPCV